jgi:hypothetical protein
VKDCKIITAENPIEAIKLIKMASACRETDSTKMNNRSSRSHSIFTMHLESSHEDTLGNVNYKMSKINFVDLAGSERQSKTGIQGASFKTATKINNSLLTLGRVVRTLATGSKIQVPFRDSKITMLLKDSLGGNTKTIMIVNINPVNYNYDESYNTLVLADSAKNIKNKPIVNDSTKDAPLKKYQDEKASFKKQLGSKGISFMNINEYNNDSLPDYENKILLMQEELEKERLAYQQGFINL